MADIMDKSIKENLEKLGGNLDKFASKAKAKINRKLTRDNTMFIVVDIQERLAPAVLDLDTIIKNTNILLKSCDLLDIPVLVTEQYPNGLGSTLAEIEENYPESTKVLPKVEFSIYENQAIKEAIDEANRPNIVLVGMEAHICVYQSVLDLQSKGFNTYVVRDGVSSRTKENYENGLDLMKSFGARVTNTETVLFELLGRAGTDEFKELSKLIK